MPDQSQLFTYLMAEMGHVAGRNPQLEQTVQKILTTCEKCGIDPLLVLALIYVESSYDPKAASKVGARGLMQLMPATASEAARSYDVEDYISADSLYNPVINVELGIRYLRQLYAHYKSSWPEALTAYNRGPGNTDKILVQHQGVIPANILALYSDLILKKYYQHIKFLSNAADLKTSVH